MSATVAEPKLCPILSVRSTTNRDGQPTFSLCQGERCMFFLPVRDDKSVMIGGSCAVTVLACEINQINARGEVKLAMQRDQNSKLERTLETFVEHAKDAMQSVVLGGTKPMGSA